MIELLISAIFTWQPCPSNPWWSKRSELSDTILMESGKWSVPAEVLTWVSFWESSWDQNAIGKRGELGPVQIMPNGPIARKCLSFGLDVASWDCAAFSVSGEWKACQGDWICFFRTHACGSIKGTCGIDKAEYRDSIRKSIGW